MKTITLFLVSLMILSLGFGQLINKETLTIQELKRFGKSTEKVGNNEMAVEFYQELYNKKPTAKTAYKLAELYASVWNYNEASYYYKMAYDADPERFGDALFYLAVNLQSTGDYENAEKNFSMFKSKHMSKSSIKRKTINTYFKSLNHMDKLTAKPVDATIQNLGSDINNEFLQASPIIINDSTLYFSSFIGNSNENVTRSRFYQARKMDDTWNLQSMDSFPANQIPENIGAGIFSSDLKRFFFTCNSTNWQNKATSAIYVSEKENGNWKKPVKLNTDINQKSYSSTQPAIGVDRKTKNEILYFVSDRPGGQGGMDIWYSSYNKETGMFERAKNAGAKINTPDDEITPFYDLLSGTLYFSSTGRESVGGYDVYCTNGEKTRWSKVRNIGSPLNSTYDDFYYVIKNNSGFLVSNRNSMETNTLDDIYSFTLLSKKQKMLKGKVINRDEGAFRRFLKRELGIELNDTANSAAQEKNLKNAIVSLYLVEEDGDLFYIESDTSNTDGLFSFNIESDQNYVLSFKTDGFFEREYSLFSDSKNNEDSNGLLSVKLDKIDQMPVEVGSVYYPVNESELSSADKTKLQETLLSRKNLLNDLFVELDSYADQKGEPEYNQNLSQARAEKLAAYLISYGVDKNHIKINAHGEVAGIGQPDTDQNRVTIIKVSGLQDQFAEFLSNPDSNPQDIL